MKKEPSGGCWAPGETSEARRTFSALPGYPFVPCKICVSEGFAGNCCDHTVLERAQAMHPGLVLYDQHPEARQ